MANERFKKIANALNSSFIEDVDTKQSLTPMVQSQPQSVPAVVSNVPVAKEVMFDEQIYVKDKLHGVIDMLGDVMGTLKKDLRQGSKASEFDAFSNLAKSTITAINELRTYDAVIKHEETYDETASKEQTDANNNITINMNGSDMLDKILEYRDREVKTIPTVISEDN